MPTLIRQNGFQVMIHTGDHRPAHVHCYRGTRLVKVQLSDLTVLFRRHATERDVREAVRIVQEHQELLRQSWRDIHGKE